MTDAVYAVLVTHRRPDELAKSLDALSSQTRAPDHLVVVDNDDDERVRDLVAGQPIPTTYLGSRRNLGGAGGFALGMLHALALGADWLWLADDDGRPHGPEVLATLLACAEKHSLAEVSPMVCDIADPERLSFPLRRGLAWRRRVSELRTEGPGQDLLPGSRRCSTARCSARPRWTRSAFPTCGCSSAATRSNCTGGWSARGCRSAPVWTRCICTRRARDEFKPILGGRMHTQYPDDATKRFFVYRNRGYLLSQPGLRKLLPQEWLRFGWYFLVSRRDPAGLREWIRLRRLGREEKFGRPGQ